MKTPASAGRSTDGVGRTAAGVLALVLAGAAAASAAPGAAIQARLGARSGDAEYSVFCDQDLDGQITEADAAAVGYFWGGSL